MEQDNAFEIKIDFAPGEGDPTRVFKAMSGLVDAISAFDSHMANSFDVLIDASLVLDSVDPGSIKAKFRDIIAGIPDEQVKEGDWRKVIGVYLIRAKYQLLKWLDGTTKISHRDDIRQLEGSLLRAAEETGLKRLPAYNPPQINLLLSVVHAIKKSLDELQDDEIATYSHGNQSIQINRDFSITLETIREVLTKERSEEHTSELQSRGHLVCRLLLEKKK